MEVVVERSDVIQDLRRLVSASGAQKDKYAGIPLFFQLLVDALGHADTVGVQLGEDVPVPAENRDMMGQMVPQKDRCGSHGGKGDKNRKYAGTDSQEPVPEGTLGDERAVGHVFPKSAAVTLENGECDSQSLIDTGVNLWIERDIGVSGDKCCEQSHQKQRSGQGKHAHLFPVDPPEEAADPAQWNMQNPAEPAVEKCRRNENGTSQGGEKGIEQSIKHDCHLPAPAGVDSGPYGRGVQRGTCLVLP